MKKIDRQVRELQKETDHRRESQRVYAIRRNGAYIRLQNGVATNYDVQIILRDLDERLRRVEQLDA